MKKLRAPSKNKRITEQQKQNRERNKINQLIARKALGFDKMKIIGIKTHKI